MGTVESKSKKIKNWKPDEAALACADCGTAFSFATRRHHCRGCGEVFCNQCSSYRAFVPGTSLDGEEDRVCRKCQYDLKARRLMSESPPVAPVEPRRPIVIVTEPAAEDNVDELAQLDGLGSTNGNGNTLREVLELATSEAAAHFVDVVRCNVLSDPKEWKVHVQVIDWEPALQQAGGVPVPSDAIGRWEQVCIGPLQQSVIFGALPSTDAALAAHVACGHQLGLLRPSSDLANEADVMADAQEPMPSLPVGESSTPLET